jgi:radical SAM superfamily enzyme YgiQ (UPF0313 family)
MSKGRVCFVIPPSPFLLDQRVFVSLGILKVAAVVKKEYDVDVLDLSGIANITEVIDEYLKGHNPIAIGITTTTPQMPAVVSIIATIRQIRPDLRIILGGTHITLVHSALGRESSNGTMSRATTAWKKLEALADVLVAGDGEKAIFEALAPNPVKVINADDPTTKDCLFLSNEDLDQLPWPARELIDMGSYHYKIDKEKAMSIVSQLGCPFGCGFCSGRSSASLRRIRSRSSQNIIAEMEFLYQTYGVKGFMFFDDELNVNRFFPELLSEIIALQKRLGVEFRLRGFVKSHLFTEEQARLMYQAGFRWILVGFESGSPEMLANMKKRATVEDNTRCVEIAHAHGLKVKALMSLGHPGESADSAQASLDWLLQVKPDDFDVTVITAYPGAPYHDEAIPCGPEVWVYTAPSGDRLFIIEVDYLTVTDFYKGNPDDGYKSFVFTDHLSPEDIVSWRDKIEREVRAKLSIPFPTGAAALCFEHSMGQQGLPSSILRSST